MLRQFYSFIVSQNSSLYMLNQFGEESAQFGHGGDQHNKIYAQSNSLPMGIATSKFLGTAEISAVFQRMVGFSNELMLKVHAGTKWRSVVVEELESIQSGRYVAPDQEVIQGTTGSVSSVAGALTINNLVNGVCDLVLPYMLEELNHRDAQCYAEVICMVTPQTIFAQTYGLVKSVEMDIHPSVLASFRKARGLPDHCQDAFSTPAQALACHLMLRTQENFVYFNATGNSILFPELLFKADDFQRLRKDGTRTRLSYSQSWHVYGVHSSPPPCITSTSR